MFAERRGRIPKRHTTICNPSAQRRFIVPLTGASAMESMRPTRILLVDDEPVTLVLLEFALRRAGYEVQTASDGEEALQLLNDHSRPVPHVIITDVCMPRRTGPELLRQIEPDPRLQGIRTILMSSDATAGKEVRCHAFVAKDRIQFDLIETLNRFEAEPC